MGVDAQGSAFKAWLPRATQMLKYRFEQAAERQKAEREENLRLGESNARRSPNTRSAENGC